jgi:HPt (histidine-containing phosphotransfer) domain-containing protein
MNIQSLLLSGYSLIDIQELLSLFIANVNDAKKVIIGINDEQIKLTVHKIKGGLIMLEFTDLIDSCFSIEDKIRASGVKPHINLVHSLLDKCTSQSLDASKELEILISNDGMNS